jgi:hypothetical protein
LNNNCRKTRQEAHKPRMNPHKPESPKCLGAVGWAVRRRLLGGVKFEDLIVEHCDSGFEGGGEVLDRAQNRL